MKTRRPPTREEQFRGRQIEDGLLRYLNDLKRATHIKFYCQPDALYLKGRRAYLIEVKSQSVFTAPPFDGHGLPVDQADRYLHLYRDTGLSTILAVWDDTTCWMQLIHILEQGPSFETSGSQTGKRRIYPLESFDRRDDLYHYRTKVA